MLVTPDANRRNRSRAIAITGILAVTTAIAGFFFPLAFSFWVSVRSSIGWSGENVSGG